MSTPGAIFGFVYVGQEPCARPSALEAAFERLTDELGFAPNRMDVATPDGRLGRSRKLTAARLQEAIRSAEAGAVYLHSTPGDEPITVQFYLRHNALIEMRFQSAGLHYAALPAGDAAVRGRRVAALESFLLAAAAPSRPLHGGIGSAADERQGIDEINMTQEASFDESGDPTVHRFIFDQVNRDRLWTKARRPYWTTILGPDLAAAAGGEAAARAAGAARVEVREGCLVVQSTDDVADFVDPEWPVRAVAIRRWLWPHTIQNPVDAPDGS